jgi:hypothetical protein
MKGTPRFGRRVYRMAPTKPKEPTVEPDIGFVPDRQARLSIALRAQWQCPCGAVKSGAFCKDCGRCFQHEVPVNGCDCPLGEP